MKMAETSFKISSAPPKRKRMTPVFKIYAKAKVEQSANFVYTVSIFLGLIQSKTTLNQKFISEKKYSTGSSQVKQKTITTIFKSKDK